MFYLNLKVKVEPEDFPPPLLLPPLPNEEKPGKPNPSPPSKPPNPPKSEPIFYIIF